MKDERDYKKEIIDQIVQDLQKRATEIHENSSMKVEDQITQMDVILNLYKMLGNYDENIYVLEEYRIKKNERLKLMGCYGLDEDKEEVEK